jgi:hypothetical protein
VAVSTDGLPVRNVAIADICEGMVLARAVDCGAAVPMSRGRRIDAEMINDFHRLRLAEIEVFESVQIRPA